MHYASPELLQGPFPFRCDPFSLAAVQVSHGELRGDLLCDVFGVLESWVEAFLGLAKGTLGGGGS